MAYRVTPDEVLFEWRQREAALGPDLRRARMVRDVAGGDYAMPLPASATPEETSSIANLVDITINSQAQRIASVSPNIAALSLKPGTKVQDDRARDQTLVAKGWRHEQRLQRKQGRRARELVAYGAAARMILPDGAALMPRWERRDPLATFPGYTSDPDDVLPPDCIFSFVRSWGWLLMKYPAEASLLYVGQEKPELNDLLDVVEYVDDEQHLLLVVGRPEAHSSRRSRVTAPAMISGVCSGIGKTITDPGRSGGSPAGHYGRHEAVVLRCAQNLAASPLAVVPGRTTLSGRRGAADGQVPLFFRMQRLTALWDEAIDRGVYPEEWLVNPNGEARVITQADGRRGILGEITNGQIVTRDLNPGYQTPQAIAQLERMLRIEGPLPAEATGEAATGVRTARRGSEILSATLDFDLAEAQLALADADRAELEVAAAVAKGYFGSRQISMYVPGRRDKAEITYRPADLFDERTRYQVSYPLAGGDRNDGYLKSMQLNGASMLSRRSAMEMSGDVEDVETEMDRIVAEQLLDALLVGIKEQAASGSIPAVDVARIAELVLSGKMDPAAAVAKAQEEAQERQAAAVPADAPEAQPGLAMPGMGVEGQPPAEAAPPPSLSDLLSQLPAPAVTGAA